MNQTIKHKLDALGRFNAAFDKFGGALMEFNKELVVAADMMKMVGDQIKEFQEKEEEARNRAF